MTCIKEQINLADESKLISILKIAWYKNSFLKLLSCRTIHFTFVFGFFLASGLIEPAHSENQKAGTENATFLPPAQVETKEFYNTNKAIIGEPQVPPTDTNLIETVSVNGSITRGTCPHSCASRGIPKESCKEWKSNMYGDKCYVQDTRLPSNAIPMEGDKVKNKK